MGYFCYETDKAPVKASDIEKRTAIAFPHAKKNGNAYGYGALDTGEGVQLHYIDVDGKDQGTKFPVGTSIGWVIYNSGYYNAISGKPINGNKSNIVYSSPSLRPYKNMPQMV